MKLIIKDVLVISGLILMCTLAVFIVLHEKPDDKPDFSTIDYFEEEPVEKIPLYYDIDDPETIYTYEAGEFKEVEVQK